MYEIVRYERPARGLGIELLTAVGDSLRRSRSVARNRGGVPCDLVHLDLGRRFDSLSFAYITTSRRVSVGW